MLSDWRTVGFAPTVPDPPRLHVRFQRSEEGYVVELTDLEYLWKEELSQKEILKRAVELETEIDPSQDRSQLDQLLRHIKNALVGEKKTALQVYALDENLTINLSAELPEPLEPLFWQVHLTRRNQHEFYESFMLPLLESHFTLSREVSSLIVHMREKDNVIDKLVGKYQSMGYDLGDLFPTLGRKSRGVKGREIAGKVVKGLGLFDEDEWRKEVGNAPISAQDPAFIKSVVEREPFNPKFDPQDKKNIPEWWKKMPKPGQHSKKGARNMLVSWPESSHARPKPRQENSTQGDFETQEEVEKEEVKKEAVNQTFSTASQFETFVDKEESPKSSLQTQEDSQSIVPETQLSQGESQSRQKSKLGRIGGARANDTGSSQPMQGSSPEPQEIKTAIEPEQESANIRQEEPAEGARTRGKLGKIGGSKESKGRNAAAATDAQANETPEELANRRREELKRNIATESTRGKPKKRRL